MSIIVVGPEPCAVDAERLRLTRGRFQFYRPSGAAA